MKIVLLVSGLAIAAIAHTRALGADQHIRLDACSLTQTDVHSLAMRAFEKRRYNIEEDTPTMVVGELEDLKVEIIFDDPTDIVIRWKEGFEHRRDQWLRNLKTDILWELAE